MEIFNQININMNESNTVIFPTARASQVVVSDI